MTYEATPGAAASSHDWPRKSHLLLSRHRATLLVMVHPQCPCTAATLGELNTLLAQCDGKVEVCCLFYKPTSVAKNWERTGLWREAAAMPGVRVLTDEGGTEAHLFHASTSGQVFLFSPSGSLLFSGGITAGRGHPGDNAGRDAIVSWVKTGHATCKRTFVFGCSLFSSNA